jgi:hypothetical protein
MIQEANDGTHITAQPSAISELCRSTGKVPLEKNPSKNKLQNPRRSFFKPIILANINNILTNLIKSNAHRLMVID